MVNVLLVLCLCAGQLDLANVLDHNIVAAVGYAVMMSSSWSKRAAAYLLDGKSACACLEERAQWRWPAGPESGLPHLPRAIHGNKPGQTRHVIANAQEEKAHRTLAFAADMPRKSVRESIFGGLLLYCIHAHTRTNDRGLYICVHHQRYFGIQ